MNNEYSWYLKKFLEDMKLRNMSVHTQRAYSAHVRKFLEFTGQAVKKLDESHVRTYLLELMEDGKIKAVTINRYNSALRLFFAVTLNRHMNYLQMPLFKEAKTLPELLTRDEIGLLFENCTNLKHKAIFMLAYGSGLRVGELARLRVCDIDSKDMRVFVKSGKGNKDRYTILSQESLNLLREYWKSYKPKHPEGWLFLGIRKQTYITEAAIETSFRKLLRKCDIRKNVSIHSMRHAFATHLLEDGTNVFQIKELLGHASLSSTAIYLHLANMLKDVKSPADRMRYHA
jgi:site-specific recombinase XerD